MPDIPLYNMEGEKKGSVKVSEVVFDSPVKIDLMHQALVRQMGNMRRGTHSTKSVGEVRGGGRKPWRQKGTGRARHGSTRSPLWVGGATIFGPKPRDYSTKMPRKMRRQALRSALTAKVKEQNVIALEELTFDEPRTRDFVEMMNLLELPNNALFVISENGDSNWIVEKSASNIQGVRVITSGTLNIHDLLKYERLVLTRDAIDKIEEVLS